MLRSQQPALFERPGEGFENAIAELVARELDRTVQYTWWPERRGFIGNTLEAHNCDMVIGVPAEYEMARTTRPYYRSTYVFATRRAGPIHVRSLDDPLLRRARIGVHVIGDDYANVPPAQSLANRAIVGNVRGYSIYGDYSRPNPPAALIDAVAKGEVDVAIAWGPMAGYFASREAIPLTVTAIQPDHDGRSRLRTTSRWASAARTTACGCSSTGLSRRGTPRSTQS